MQTLKVVTLRGSEKYLVFHNDILLSWHVLDLINDRFQGYWFRAVFLNHESAEIYIGWKIVRGLKRLRTTDLESCPCVGNLKCKECPTMWNTSKKALNCLKTNVVTPRGRSCGKFSSVGDSQLTVLVIQKKRKYSVGKNLYTMVSKRNFLVCRINFWDPRLFSLKHVSYAVRCLFENFMWQNIFSRNIGSFKNCHFLHREKEYHYRAICKVLKEI